MDRQRALEVVAWLFKWSIILLGVSLSCSKFLMTIGQISALFFLLVGFILDRKLLQKPSLFFWGFILLYGLHILWLIPDGDLAYGLKDLRIKLPLLTIPFAFAFAPAKWLPSKNMLFGFLLAGFIGSTLYSFTLYMGWTHWREIQSFRDYSPLVSHIRLITIGVGLFFWSFFLWKKQVWKVLAFGIYLALVISLFQSLTGLATLGFGMVFGLLKWGSKWVRISTVVTAIALVSVVFAAWQNYNTLDPEYRAPQKTDKSPWGVHYKNTSSHQINNHHPIWDYVEKGSMRFAWLKRTNISPDSLTENGNRIEGILINYLTAKGLRKDLNGVNALSEEDISKILKGHFLPDWEEKTPLERRMITTFNEINLMRDGMVPNGQSVSLRLLYLQTGFNIWEPNKWLGIGTRNIQNAFQQYYQEELPQLKEQYRRKTHNQWMSFLILFGIIGCLPLLLFFAYSMPKTKLASWALLVLLTQFLTFFWEDTLENQVGVTVFSFFFCLCLIYSKEPDKISL